MKVIDDVNEVVLAIDISPHRWKGNCSWITAECYYAGLVPKTSRVCYGGYYGEIAPDGHFGDRAFSHHSWIELPDFTIYDPTRWVFTNTRPAIWRGPARHEDYDLGMSKQYARQPPPMPLQKPPFKITVARRVRLKHLLPWMHRNGPDFGQWYWLAHRHPDKLGADARWIYRSLQKHKLSAIIPTDFKRYVFHINPTREETRPKPATVA